MSAEDSKRVNLQWIQAFNERDWVAEASYRTSDYVAHMSGIPMPLDGDGWHAFMIEFTQAFPDAQISVDASVGERDIVASRWTITGTHGGAFQGVPATGRLIGFAGCDFSRVVDGKVAEHWAQFDLVSVLQQIGALPAPTHARGAALVDESVAPSETEARDVRCPATHELRGQDGTGSRLFANAVLGSWCAG
jgi:steroid delta-isomerase-like uncharacterized protein